MTGPEQKEPIMVSEQEMIDFESFLPYYFHLIAEGLNQRFRTILKPHGVTIRRWRILMVLMTSGTCNMTELREKSLIEQSALSRVVDQMERDNLVVRRPKAGDNRIIEVFLTDQGRRSYCDLVPAARIYAESTVEGMPKRERQALLNSLKKILHNLEMQ